MIPSARCLDNFFLKKLIYVTFGWIVSQVSQTRQTTFPDAKWLSGLVTRGPGSTQRRFGSTQPPTWGECAPSGVDATFEPI
jgi:hypothetical protein